MLVGSPFLPAIQAAETESQNLDRVMAGATAGDGGFPVSVDMNWHGGTHWDDGCVVIQHETDIGADDSTSALTQVVFFSVYMHLATLETLAVGDDVFRKDKHGTAGSIYGDANRIHLEVVCDDANVGEITGRTDSLPAARGGNGARREEHVNHVHANVGNKSGEKDFER